MEIILLILSMCTLSMINLDVITKKLYGINFVDWLKKEYYGEYEWLFTRDFLNIFVLINYLIVFIFSPILVNILFFRLLYIITFKK